MTNKALENRHPVHTEGAPLWQYYRDHYEGGPLYPAKQNPLPAAVGGSVAFGEHGQKRAGRYTGTRNYIWQYPLERDEKYMHRLARAVYCNLVGPIVDYYCATVGKAENATVTPEGDAFAEFLDDADLQGQSFAQFLSAVRPSKTVSGCDFILIDMPAVSPDVEVVTLRDQKEQRLRPYVVAIPRENVLNWRLDQFGRPLEVLYRCEAPSGGSLLDENGAACKEQLRYWTPQEWRVFEKLDGKEWLQVSEGVNQLGEIPIVPLYHLRIAAFKGESLLKDAAKYAQLLSNWISSFDENLEASMFPVPVFKSTKSPADAGVGAATIMHLNPEEQEEFLYVSPDTGPFEAGWKAFALMTALAYRHMGINAKSLTMAGAANDPQSGVSKEWDFAETEKVLASMAGAEEDAVKQILYFVGRYLKSEWKGVVQYARKFDLSSAKELVENLILLQTAGAPISARQQILIRAVQRVLTSLDEKKLEQIVEDILAMKEAPAEMPAPGGAPGGAPGARPPANKQGPANKQAPAKGAE